MAIGSWVDSDAGESTAARVNPFSPSTRRGTGLADAGWATIPPHANMRAGTGPGTGPAASSRAQAVVDADAKGSGARQEAPRSAASSWRTRPARSQVRPSNITA